MKIACIERPSFFFAGNAAEVVFRAAGLLTTPAVKARLVLELDSANTPDTADVLKFIWGSTTLTFTCGTVTLNDPLIISAYSAGSWRSYVQLLVDQLKRHPTLWGAYDIYMLPAESADTVIYIMVEARESGAAYTLTTTGTSAEFAVSSNTAGVDAEYEANFKLNMEVEVEHNEPEPIVTRHQLEATGTIDEVTGEADVTFYELPEVGRPTLKFMLPALPKRIFRAHHLHTTMRMRVNAEADSGVGKSKFEDLSDFTGVGGLAYSRIYNLGLPMSHHGAQENYYDYIFENDPARRFFTWQPRTKVVTDEQPEWLMVWMAGGAGVYKRKTVITYTDNTTATVTESFTVTDTGMYVVPAGYEQTELAAVTPAKTVLRWTVVIRDNGDTTSNSETFTYIRETRYNRHDRYIVFQNSLGGIDTVRFTGHADKNLSRASEINELATDSKSRQWTGAMQMSVNQVSEELTAYSGFVAPDVYTWLEELLHSREVYEYLTPMASDDRETVYRQPYRKLIVRSDKSTEVNEDSMLRSHQFALMPAVRNRYMATATPIGELGYDTTVEVVIEVESVSGGTPLVRITGVAAAQFEWWLNGKIMNGASTGTLAVGIYKIVVKGTEMTTLTLDFDDVVVTANPTKIETLTLSEFKMLDVENLKHQYLCKRIERWRALESLVLTGSNPNVADAILVSCANKHSRYFFDTYGAMTDVDVSDFPALATDEGTAASAWLTTNGVTVTV